MTDQRIQTFDQSQMASAPRVYGDDAFPDAVLLALALAAAVGAGVLTAAVQFGAAGRIDQWVFGLVPPGSAWTPALAPWWWREAVRDATALGGALFLTGAVVAACLYLLASGRRRLSGLLLGSAIGATFLSTGLKIIVGRDRPDSIEHLVATASASFPSGHALLSAAIILTIGGLTAFAAKSQAERNVIVLTALIVSICAGLSRVWLGVHWPSDVLAGWMLGIVWACLTLWLAKRIARQGGNSKNSGSTSSRSTNTATSE